MNPSPKAFFFSFFFEKFRDFELLKEFENFDWLLFFFWKWSKKYEPNAPSPKAFFLKKIEKLEYFEGIENFDFDFFFFFEKLRNLDLLKEFGNFY